MPNSDPATGRELVLICGSRAWSEPEPIRAASRTLTPGSSVLVGGAPGADTIAERHALARDDLDVRFMPADWARHGRRAGILRNLAMLDQHPDRVIPCQCANSPGTAHTIREATRRGIPVELITRP
jgi:YspA, cpYpsA-related SLOG family